MKEKFVSRGIALAASSLSLFLVSGLAVPASALDAVVLGSSSSQSRSADEPKSEYVGKSFKDMDFDGENFSNEDLSGAHFDDSRMTDVVLDGATAFRTTFQNSILIRASVKGAHFTYTSFQGANLTGVDFREVGSLKGTVFGGAVLDGANFSGLDLSGANFAGANLSGVILDDVINVDPQVVVDAAELTKQAAEAKKAADDYASEVAAAVAAQQAKLDRESARAAAREAYEAAGRAKAEREEAQAEARARSLNAHYVVIFDGDLKPGQTKGFIEGRCPIEYPYVKDEYAHSRGAGTGIVVDAGSKIGVRMGTWHPDILMGGESSIALANGFKNGYATNWDFGSSQHLTISLACTANRDLAYTPMLNRWLG